MAEPIIPPEGPLSFRSGSYVTEAQLADLAAEAIRRRGLTLTAAAAELGRSVSSVSDAVNQPSRPMGSLRREIVARYAGYTVEGPLYRLRKVEGDR